MKTTYGLLQFCGGDATFCQNTAHTYGSAAVLPKHVSQQHRVVNRFILYSLYYVAIYFLGGMLRRTVVNLTCNESRCAV